MRLKWMPGAFTVCQITSPEHVCWDAPYTFLCRTEEELSLVCETSRVPASAIRRADGWRMFAVEGPLDFGLTGVLAGIADCLAQAEIPIFAVSTYETDYILLRAAFQNQARRALERAGYTWAGEPEQTAAR